MSQIIFRREIVSQESRAHLKVLRLGPEDDTFSLQSELDENTRVEIDFPTFMDGRGYTHAFRIRNEMGFKGEIRAVGDIGRDQAHYLERSGFDAFDFREGTDLEGALEALTIFPMHYRGIQTLSTK